MTDTEKRIAEIIDRHYHEEETSYPYIDRKLYAGTDLADFNGVISSQDEETDVLMFQHTINEEQGEDYIQLFISSPDDMAQDFVNLSDLTEEEQATIVKLFADQVEAEFGIEFAI